MCSGLDLTHNMFLKKPPKSNRYPSHAGAPLVSKTPPHICVDASSLAHHTTSRILWGHSAEALYGAFWAGGSPLHARGAGSKNVTWTCSQPKDNRAGDV
jgi:hypothetical protein